MEPYTRHMHMSLGYRFSDEHQAKIEELARKIDTQAKCQWELRIYSRDMRITSHEVCILSETGLRHSIIDLHRAPPVELMTKLFFLKLVNRW